MVKSATQPCTKKSDKAGASRSAEASSAAKKRKGSSSSSSSSAVSESEQTRKALQRARQQEALALRAEGKEYTPTKRQRKRKPKERRKWDERAASKLQAKRELGKKLRKEKKGAPEVVVVPIFWKGQAGQRGKVLTVCADVQRMLAEAGKRVEVDAGHKYTPGQKFAHWEHRGTMLRVEVGPRESERGCCTVARTFTPGEPAHRVEQVQVEAEGLVAELERLAALKEEERDAAAERAVADKGMTHNGSWKIAAVGGRGKSSAAAAAPPSESAAEGEAPARSAEPARKRAKVVKF